MLEGHVEPIAVILCTDPAGGPKAKDKADLREDYGVGCGLRVVSCLLGKSASFRSMLGFSALPLIVQPVLLGLQVPTYMVYCKLVLHSNASMGTHQ